MAGRSQHDVSDVAAALARSMGLFMQLTWLRLRRTFSEIGPGRSELIAALAQLSAVHYVQLGALPPLLPSEGALRAACAGVACVRIEAALENNFDDEKYTNTLAHVSEWAAAMPNFRELAEEHLTRPTADPPAAPFPQTVTSLSLRFEPHLLRAC